MPEKLSTLLRDWTDWRVLAALARRNPQFHEPDEQDLTAEVRGRAFDNAMMDESEKHVVLKRDGIVIARLNLASLLGLAAEALQNRGD